MYEFEQVLTSLDVGYPQLVQAIGGYLLGVNGKGEEFDLPDQLVHHL